MKKTARRKPRYQIGYKVVVRRLTERSDHYQSAFVSTKTNSPRFVLRYDIGKVTRPKIKGTKMFAFKSLKEAKDYASDYASDSSSALTPYILIARLYGVTNHKPWLGNFIKNTRRLLAWFRNHKPDEYTDYPSAVLCSAIKPISLLD
jgi:hypothetical protein